MASTSAGVRSVSKRLPMRNSTRSATPARVQGRWEVRQGNDRFDLDIRQSYQEFSGRATLNGTPMPVRDGRIHGSEIRFAIETAPGRTRSFRGRVKGDAIEALSGGGAASLARQSDS